jgi:hypothetical protein
MNLGELLASEGGSVTSAALGTALVATPLIIGSIAAMWQAIEDLRYGQRRSSFSYLLISACMAFLAFIACDVGGAT